jgi:DNA modification methylase
MTRGRIDSGAVQTGRREAGASPPAPDPDASRGLASSDPQGHASDRNTVGVRPFPGPGALPTELVDIDSIAPYPDNPHTGDVVGVASSLSRYGQWRAIVCQTSTRYVLAGNTTWKSAKRIGWRQIWVQWIDCDAVTAAAINLADNRWGTRGSDDEQAVARLLQQIYEAGQYSEAIGYTPRQLDAFLTSLVARDPDALPPMPHVSVKPGDAFMLGDHRLVCGDALDPAVYGRLFREDEKADCVFTSPPYAVGVDYGSYVDTIENLRDLLARAAREWREIVGAGGFAVTNFNDVVTGRALAGSDGPCEYPMALEYWPPFRAEGWSLWSRRIWCKPVARTNSPWTRPTNRAASNFEHIWTWKAPGKALVNRVDGALASPDGWFDSTSIEGVAIGKDEHGAPMPTGVAARGIGIHSRRGGIVHEPFCGTGTTLIAAQQLGRRCYAAEIEPRYVQMTIARWEAFTGLRAAPL